MDKRGKILLRIQPLDEPRFMNRTLDADMRRKDDYAVHVESQSANWSHRRSWQPEKDLTQVPNDPHAAGLNGMEKVGSLFVYICIFSCRGRYQQLPNSRRSFQLVSINSRVDR